MNKHWILVGIIVLLFAVGNAGLFVWSRIQKPTVPSKGTQTSTLPSPLPTQSSLKTWGDPAGFTFQYPQGLTTNKHEEDNESYAHVELTDSSHKGNIIVWAKDAPKGKNRKVVTSLAEWIESDTRFDSANILDTMLGGKPAKKILLHVPKKMILSGTLSDGLLFSVEGNFDDTEYWTPIYTRITDSFQFTTPNDTQGSVGQMETGKSVQPAVNEPAGGVEEAVDEEEVIE